MATQIQIVHNLKEAKAEVRNAKRMKAFELYQAGNVVESQKLYDEISQLNQSLKQNEAVLINK